MPAQQVISILDSIRNVHRRFFVSEMSGQMRTEVREAVSHLAEVRLTHMAEFLPPRTPVGDLPIK